MFSSSYRMLFSVSTAFALLGGTWAAAQAPSTVEPPEVPGPTSPALESMPQQPLGAVTSQPGQLQSILIDILISGNRAEVALGELAQNKAQNPQVKEFAQQMIHDHGDLVNRLQGLRQSERQQLGGALPGGMTVPKNPAPPEGVQRQAVDQRSPAQQGMTPSASGQNAMGAGGTNVSLASVLGQFHQRMVDQTKKDLLDLQGAEFDQAYIFQQIGGHVAMAAMLETFKPYVSPQAQQLFPAALKTTQDHLAHAKQLKQQITPEVARKPGEGGTPR
jgi:predicted outer membrane protein